MADNQPNAMDMSDAEYAAAKAAATRREVPAAAPVPPIPQPAAATVATSVKHARDMSDAEYAAAKAAIGWRHQSLMRRP